MAPRRSGSRRRVRGLRSICSKCLLSALDLPRGPKLSHDSRCTLGPAHRRSACPSCRRDWRRQCLQGTSNHLALSRPHHFWPVFRTNFRWFASPHELATFRGKAIGIAHPPLGAARACTTLHRNVAERAVREIVSSCCTCAEASRRCRRRAAPEVVTPRTRQQCKCRQALRGAERTRPVGGRRWAACSRSRSRRAASWRPHRQPGRSRAMSRPTVRVHR